MDTIQLAGNSEKICKEVKTNNPCRRTATEVNIKHTPHIYTHKKEKGKQKIYIVNKIKGRGDFMLTIFSNQKASESNFLLTTLWKLKRN